MDFFMISQTHFKHPDIFRMRWDPRLFQSVCCMPLYTMPFHCISCMRSHTAINLCYIRHTIYVTWHIVLGLSIFLHVHICNCLNLFYTTVLVSIRNPATHGRIGSKCCPKDLNSRLNLRYIKITVVAHVLIFHIAGILTLAVKSKHCAEGYRSFSRQWNIRCNWGNSIWPGWTKSIALISN